MLASSKKLWKIVKYMDNYYFVIKYDGDEIDKLRIEEPILSYLKQKGEIK